MPTCSARRVLLVTAALIASITAPLPADEGMWPINRFPADTVRAKYGFAPSAAWLAHAQRASVRLVSGCSGSFVSPYGLVMTNYHCAVECVEALSSKDSNFSATGFHAPAQGDERQCPGMEINQLTGITDVTTRVAGATAGKEGEQFEAARRAAVASIEGECATTAGVRCDVVSLYHGGKYDLYKYRRFQDVRLVFAPEFAVGFFGGDPDNFMFPRYNLDLAFLRVYDEGRPLASPDYFRWSAAGGAAGDPVFVTGHPGGTSRLYTVAQLEFDRDVTRPQTLLTLSELRGLLIEFQRRGEEQARVSGSMLVIIENALKVYRGQFAALTDPRLIAAKRDEEAALRTAVARDPALAAKYGGSWDAVARVLTAARAQYARHATLGALSQSTLFNNARALVRLPVESAKPNGERLPAYTDAARPALEQALRAETPISKELETLLLSFLLRRVREDLGLDSDAARALLGRRSPDEVAAEAVRGTTLDAAAARVALLTGGQAAVDASTDPMIRLVKAIDAIDRQVRKRYEDEIDAELTRHTAAIAQARFAVHGDRIYPDATFTLRVSYGSIKGWTEGDAMVTPFTTLAGLYDRHSGSPPFNLPARWLDAKPKVKLDTPFNLVADTDIIGGNSGSPLLNRVAEIVGLVFDGNIHAIGGEYWFDAAKNRTVAVDSRGIREALASVYGASRIVGEIDAARQAKAAAAP
jgi:hypothetical protein